MLMLQTFWLLPVLNERADLYINDQSVAQSNLHIWFMVAEVTKVVLLVIFGIGLLRSIKHYIS